MEGVGQPELLPSHQPCLNCGDPTEGNYCRICGQRKVEHRVALRVMLRDALQDQFALTVELPRTLRALFTRPGFLTTEYSEGRIARYIEPLRLYLIASVIVFLLLSVITNRSQQNLERSRAARAAEQASKPKAAVPKAPARARKRSSNAVVDRCLRESATGMRFCTPIEALNRAVAPRIRELNKLPPGEAGKRVSNFLIARASIVIFMLLPVLAGFLKLAFWRTRKYYAEHFVFALHVHAFAFFVIAFTMIMPKLAGFQYVNRLLLVWVAVYMLIALKRYYRQGWMITTAKYVVLSMAYSIMIFLAIAVEVIVAFYLA